MLPLEPSRVGQP